jgi:hypothetical protein
MTEEENIIVTLVTGKTAIKGTELVTKAIGVMCANSLVTPETDVPEMIDDLVARGEIMELEYVIPAMNYRIKSLYFPKGTEIKQVRLGKEVN